MNGRYRVYFPLQAHFDRFYEVLKDNPAAPEIKAAIERLQQDPRPADMGFEEVPPAEEAQFLIRLFGVPLAEDFPSVHYRAFAQCRIRAGGHWILYDVMDDLRIIWLFDVVAAVGG